MAPGVNIVSTNNDLDAASNNCGTRTMSGTSMASPGGAGLAALIRQYYSDGFYPSGSAQATDAFTPSGALIKASLIHSAADLAREAIGRLAALHCTDARCSEGGVTCTDVPSVPGTFCCGLFGCETGEDCGNCALDCAEPAEQCSDGTDNGCNGAADCADAACTGDPACEGCTGGQPGDACTSDTDCCSLKCRGPSGNRTCR